MGRLQNKVAIITGAGSGIGAASALRMAEEGAKVVVVGRRLANVQSIAAQIIAAGGEATALSADIAEESQIQTMVQQTIEKYGRIDVLYNNAALTDAASMGADGLVHEMDAATWDRVMQVNLRGPMLCCKYVIPHMLKQGGGSILISGSGKGTLGDLSQPAYGASKAGLINLTQNVATQYGKQGIRANIIVVGLVLTEGLKENFPTPIQDMMASHHLTPFIGEPIHIADTAVFLASDESAFITGHTIHADGGFTAHAPSVADFRKMMAG